MISFCEFRLTSWSSCNQCQSVSKETVVSWTVVDGEENDKEKRLCLSGNSVSVDISYAVLDYRQLSGKDDTV